MHADANTLPTEDTSNDVTLISSSETDGKTKLVFSRKRMTCDSDDRELTVSTCMLMTYVRNNDTLLPTTYLTIVDGHSQADLRLRISRSS